MKRSVYAVLMLTFAACGGSLEDRKKAPERDAGADTLEDYNVPTPTFTEGGSSGSGVVCNGGGCPPPSGDPCQGLKSPNGTGGRTYM